MGVRDNIRKLYGYSLMKQFFSLLTFTILTRVVAILTNFYLAASLGLSIYGELVLTLAIWGALSGIQHGGYYKLLLVNRTLRGSFVLGLRYCSLLLAAIFFIVGYKLPFLELSFYSLSFLTLSILINSLSLPWLIFLERNSDFYNYSKIKFLSQLLLSLTLVLSSLSLSENVIEYSFFAIFISVLFTFIYFKVQKKYVNSFRSNLDYKEKGYDLKSALINLSSNFCNVGVIHGDKYLIAAAYNLEVLGFFNLMLLIFVQTANLLGQAFYKPLLIYFRDNSIWAIVSKLLNVKKSAICLTLILLFYMSLVWVLLYFSFLLPDNYISLWHVYVPVFSALFLFKMLEWLLISILDANKKFSLRLKVSLVQVSLLSLLYFVLLEFELISEAIYFLIAIYILPIFFYIYSLRLIAKNYDKNNISIYP